MKNKFLPSAILFLMLLVFGYVLSSPSIRRAEHSVCELSEWTLAVGAKETSHVSLPLTLKNLAPRTAVTLTTSVHPEAGSQIYLKTVYAPVRVYADGELIFSYGQDGTYPAILSDPPTKIEILPLTQTGRPLTLRLEFLSPSQRDSMTVYPVLSGSADAILEQLFSNMGFSLLFSIVLIALGILLSLTAVVLARVEKTGKALLLLGIFSFLVGIWIFGECNLTALFIDNPSLLYLTAFLGLFTLAVPMLKFGLTILRSSICRKLLRYMDTALEVSICAAILLQLMGTMPFARSMYLFHTLIPAALCIFAGCILWEAFRCKNPLAVQFLFPVTLLSLFPFWR